MKRLIAITLLSLLIVILITQITRSEITVFSNKATKTSAEEQKQTEQTQDSSKNSNTNKAPMKSLAEQLESSLQTSAKIYTANEQKYPKKFSDYVVPDGEAKKPYTFSMAELNKILVTPLTEKDLASSSLTLIFKTGLKARYDLYFSKSDISVELTLLK